MKGFTPTRTQNQAINARRSSVLVSAAAGSGKTRVITERVMSYILDVENPASIRDFLIITFTKAAASELKSRIGKAIQETMREHPEYKGLKEQHLLCRQASIGTIHSFCQNILKENSHVIGIAPDFRVIDEDRASIMKLAAMEKVLEDRYEKMDSLPEFEELVNLVGTGRDDTKLVTMALDLYEKMQSHAFPSEWAEEQKSQFSLEEIENPGATIWGRELLRQTQVFAREWTERWDKILEETAAEEPELYQKVGESLEATREGLRLFKKGLGEGWTQAAPYAEIPFPRMVVPQKLASARSEKIKKLRKQCQDQAKKMSEPFLRQTEQIIDEIRIMAPSMNALLDLVADFSVEYQKRKRRASMLDFSDLEHMALKLLEDEKGNPTAIAEALSERFCEIMVDEYQDVSEVQEHLFNAVSRGKQNLFMVGDVKQSIYRFRLADPQIFLRKYNDFQDFDDAEEKVSRKIFLQENFRSRKEIIHAVNHVFKTCMSPEVGELSYDEKAALHFGATDYEGEVPVPEIIVLENEDSEDEEAPDKVRKEAELVAQRILGLMNDKTRTDNNARPLEFGDIAILLRSANTVGKQYQEVLSEYGIPAVAGGGNGFFQAMEIANMISLLSLIDNPYQDIPLIAVLNSPMFGVSPDELTEICAVENTWGLYESVRKLAPEHSACLKLTNLIERYRVLAPDVKLSSFLWALYDELNAIAIFSSMSGGNARRENLLTLLEYTKKFEATGYHGIRRFLQWIRRQEERGQNPVATSETSAVQILSIHKSKGLEFPVVFLCDTGRQFNKSDSRETVLIHPELGLGPKLVDLKNRYAYPTIARLAIRNRIEKESASEEMRLLYVAMTRAKERLIITGSMKKTEKTIEDMKVLAESPMLPEVVEKAGTPLIWLMYAALTDTEGVLRWSTVQNEELGLWQEPEEEVVSSENKDTKWAGILDERLNYTYPHTNDTKLPGKITATELKKRLVGPKQEREEDSQVLWEYFKRLYNPVFLPFEEYVRKKNSGSTRAGTATHLVLQYLNFRSAQNRVDIQKQIQDMIGKGILSEEEGKMVNISSILQFLRSDTGRSMTEKEDRLNREFTFSVLIPAKRLLKASSEEKILLQGAIDCWYEENGELVVVDYKTDHVKGSELEQRAKDYEIQVSSYAQALEEIIQKPVKKSILYFLNADKEVVIPVPKHL